MTNRRRKKKFRVKKASGDRETFSSRKFHDSLVGTGISEADARKIEHSVEVSIRDDTSTDQIFKRASDSLYDVDPAAAARYRLKKGIMQLGPAGFLFEKYFAAVIAEHGYDVRTVGEYVQGKCVEHEIDIDAHKNDIHYFVELKYHNSGGVKSDIQHVMYLYARLLDLAEAKQEDESYMFEHKAWLVTNTKFTSKAKQYAECKDIMMTGWNYPKKDNLKEMIESKNLYPITVLPSLSREGRELLAKGGVMFVRDLANVSSRDLQKRYHLTKRVAEKISAECVGLCDIN